MLVLSASVGVGLVVLAGRFSLGSLSDLGLSGLERGLAWFLAGAALVGALGVLLGTLGWFSPALLLPAVALAGAGAALARRYLARPSAPAAATPGRDRWLLLALVPVAAALLAAGPFDWSLGGRDPGNYVNAAHGLARSGGFEVQLSAYPLLPPEARPSALANDETGDQYGSPVPVQGMYFIDEESGTAVAQGFPLYPTLMAFARWFAGPELMLWTTIVLAFVGVALVAVLARRLGGTVAGVVAALLLGLNLIQLWWGRFPNSEIAMQIFVLGGAWAFMLAYELRSRVLFGLAGAAFGATLLARPDAVLVVGVIGAVLLGSWLLGTFRRETVVGGVSLAAVGAIAAFHAALLQRPYLEDSFQFGSALLGAPSLALAGVPPAAAAGYALRRPLRRLFERSPSIAAHAAGVAVAVFGLGSMVLGWPGTEWLEVYLGRVGLGAAWLALGYLTYHEWKRDRISRLGPLLVFALLVAALYLREPLISVDLPWATRRFLPVLVPMLALAVGVAAGRIVQRRALSVAVAGAVAFLVGWQLWIAWPSLAFRMHEGSGELVERVAARMDEDALVIMGPDYIAGNKLGIPLSLRYGRDVLPLHGGSGWDPGLDATAAWIRRQAMRRVVFLLMTKESTSINRTYLEPYLQARIPFSLVMDAPDDSLRGPLPARMTWTGTMTIVRLDYKRRD